jgi:RNA polymerase sigma factor (TIGR02999 family)
MSDVTRLLDAAATGDRRAAADLLPLVYDQLRQSAAARMGAESPGQTLQPTAVVHEAYLRLIGPADEPRWENCGHFFAAPAEAMRRILVENARRKRTAKRDGPCQRLDVDAHHLYAPAESEDILALDRRWPRQNRKWRSW